jgi:hypothetical protein
MQNNTMEVALHLEFLGVMLGILMCDGHQKHGHKVMFKMQRNVNYGYVHVNTYWMLVDKFF